MSLNKLLAKHPAEIQRLALLAAIADEYRGSLYKTAKDLLGYSDITWYTHGKTIEALEESTKRKLLVLPRGTFKSSIGCVAYPIWSLIRDWNERILIDSEVYENSKNFIREIKGKLEESRIVQLFGSFRSDTNWSESSITIRQRTKVFKESSITASGIGAGKTGQHYGIIIGDDYNSPKNSETPEQRQKVIRHYKMNTSILNPDGIMAIIGTRYATDDVIGHIIESEIKAA